MPIMASEYEYRYSQEISQMVSRRRIDAIPDILHASSMLPCDPCIPWNAIDSLTMPILAIPHQMFVFAELSDPQPEVVRLVEDIVRSQVLELIMQSRALSQRRGSRFVNAEDLIFLIRDDRAKVNRLKTYLSWKDVRKNAKDSEGGDAAAAGPEEESADAVPKTKAKKIRLPWEITTVFTEHLVNNAAEEDEEDEEDIEALEESLQRLKVSSSSISISACFAMITSLR